MAGTGMAGTDCMHSCLMRMPPAPPASPPSRIYLFIYLLYTACRRTALLWRSLPVACCCPLRAAPACVCAPAAAHRGLLAVCARCPSAYPVCVPTASSALHPRPVRRRPPHGCVSRPLFIPLFIALSCALFIPLFIALFNFLRQCRIATSMPTLRHVYYRYVQMGRCAPKTRAACNITRSR